MFQSKCLAWSVSLLNTSITAICNCLKCIHTHTHTHVHICIYTNIQLQKRIPERLTFKINIWSCQHDFSLTLSTTVPSWANAQLISFFTFLLGISAYFSLVYWIILTLGYKDYLYCNHYLTVWTIRVRIGSVSHRMYNYWLRRCVSA